MLFIINQPLFLFGARMMKPTTMPPRATSIPSRMPTRNKRRLTLDHSEAFRARLLLSMAGVVSGDGGRSWYRRGVVYAIIQTFLVFIVGFVSCRRLERTWFLAATEHIVSATNVWFHSVFVIGVFRCFCLWFWRCLWFRSFQLFSILFFLLVYDTIVSYTFICCVWADSALIG